MSFFRINLNRLADPTAALRKERRESYAFLALAGLFAALTVTAGRYNGAMESKIRELRGLRSDLNSQIEALERDSDFVSEEDVRALHDLDRERIFWTRKLVSLAGLTGDKIVFTGIRYDQGKLSLEGVAQAGTVGRGEGGNKFELVSAFIDRLQASADFARDFRKVEFLSSKRVDFQDQTLLSFEVICLPK
ncbi:MAG TPA: PilN domain-containing protein [Fibrobacteria bacterium]|nr:PilN domain-containing protein [Fibrobacteria bacterium]